MIADLKDKIALVTGAGSGIGRGIALVLAEQGASVAVTDLKEEWASATAKAANNSDVIPLALDVVNKKSVQSSVAEIISRWGHLDILVNNAGIPSGSVVGREDSEADWDRTRCASAY